MRGCFIWTAAERGRRVLLHKKPWKKAPKKRSPGRKKDECFLTVKPKGGRKRRKRDEYN